MRNREELGGFGRDGKSGERWRGGIKMKRVAVGRV